MGEARDQAAGALLYPEQFEPGLTFSFRDGASLYGQRGGALSERCVETVGIPFQWRECTGLDVMESGLGEQAG